MLGAAGALYFAAEVTPFDRVDAWIDGRFFWEPIALVAIALLLVLVVDDLRKRRRLADGASAPGPPSELVPICMRCKAVRDDDDSWEPIEAYLAYRTPDKFTRSMCPACLELIAS